MFLHVRKVKGSETSEDKALKFCIDSVLVLISILSDGIFGNASRFDFMIFEYLNHVIFTCKTVKKKNPFKLFKSCDYLYILSVLILKRNFVIHSMVFDEIHFKHIYCLVAILDCFHGKRWPK